MVQGHYHDHEHPLEPVMKNQTFFSKMNSMVMPAVMTLLMMMFIILGIGGNARAGTIAPGPLFLTTAGVDPNIMFILDDSGSMMFEIMPDDYTYWGQTNGSIVYVFPRVSGVYGADDYTNNVVTTSDTSSYTALARSSAFNKIYYNPAITYTPWKKYDGSSYANASTTCPYHNPENTGAGCRSLTANIPTAGPNWRNCNATGCNSSTPSSTFWPATYFTYNGGNQWTRTNYTKTEIKSATPTYSGDGRTSRTDCTGGVCTYAQEIQNFANWYTYYRSRILAARAGVGKAFVNQSEKLRVGFGTINKGSTSIDGVNAKAVITGVRPFTSTNREAFFDQLYNRDIPAQGTPLRLALDAAGLYFSRTDDRGPWSSTPGQTGGTDYTCRQSYTILMTDGYWNGDQAGTTNARANNDGTAGPTITEPAHPPVLAQSFTYSAVSPFTDNWTNTLADVAMYYWKRDLRTDLANRVPINTADPAFWQHMVTFGVGLGVNGSVDPTTAFAAIGGNTTITWPQPSDTGTSQNIDDLLHAAVNGRGGFFSATDPDTFATQLSTMLETIVARKESSAAALAANSTRLDVDTAIYQSMFNSEDWSGQVAAKQFNADGTVSDTDLWNTNTAGKIPAPQADNGTITATTSGRKIYTLVGNVGKEFLWENLDTGQKTDLRSTDTVTVAEGQKRLNWIRGDQSNEKPVGTLRTRTKLLGDIVNSSPFYVGAPLDFGYQAMSGYTTFREAKKNRTKMLYVGANDGMLHAFDATCVKNNDPDAEPPCSNTTAGQEKFAFIPKVVFPNLPNLTASNYTHQYFVDGSPYVGDVQIGGVWKSILIGATGAGGRSVFALDVTDPDNFSASNVLWEFTDTNDMGYPVGQIGQVAMGRLQNGTWVAVFGNGYNSTSGKAFLFVVNVADGTLIAKIATNSSVSNGLAAPVLLADASKNVVAAYAGDLLGNLWKFDLTNNTVAFSNPLFKARDAAGNIQPITAPPEIGKHPNGGYIIVFGTGKYFEEGDHNASATPRQSLYGIWDTAVLNSNAWQGGSAITATNRSGLQAQTVKGQTTTAGNNWRLVSQTSVVWSGSGAKRGWYMDLPADGERVTDSPTLSVGRAIFITRVPRVLDDLCVPSAGTAWLMVVDLVTGGRTVEVSFDVNRDKQFNALDDITVGGERGAASGFEGIRAGLSTGITLIVSSRGIDVLLSGTDALTTTADATSAATGSDATAAAAAVAAKAVADAAKAAADTVISTANAAAATAQATANDAAVVAAAAAARLHFCRGKISS
ncbi:putative type 4 fimbrial biogenesis protein PilY1 [Candidatus Contendobacter odensis Run_B_J11]|uniref:Type 4 fimbrial biogenesis protein PilY1 n=2 Tax=Candidatus Contendibacter odensensis TaxID=1400860 RepID=A0A7U7GAZ3_9GAMM|nr:putative type 4 fimbrial biogenesis protein PilY1 [Candidatus Contendobacter odensis Run_B_J11]